MSEKMPFYGGQALIEGVLMRGSQVAVATIKDFNGQIHIHHEPLTGIYQGNLKNIPFLRGIIALWDAIVLGSRFLTMSANHQLENPDEHIKGPSLFFTFFISFAIGILLFFIAPAYLCDILEKWLQINPWVGNLIEGLMRVLILIVYLVSIRRNDEILRVFKYHGAEHKTINTYEANLPLTVENVSKSSLVHPRCGTSFLLTVVLFSIILFSLLGPLPVIWRLVSRLLFIIPLTSISYEYIRWSAKHLNNPFVSVLITPNLWLQKLTTSDPTDEMMEIGITSLNEVIKRESLIVS